MTRTRIRGRAIAALVPLLAAPALAGIAMPAASVSTATATATATVGGERSKLLHRTNAERAAKGCGDLTVNRRLTTSAQDHAADMSRTGYFSHSSKNGTSWNQRIEKSGYDDPGGENIATGFKSADRVLKAWMDSPTHRRNIVNCDFRHIGVGYAAAGGYWVQDFGYASADQ